MKLKLYGPESLSKSKYFDHLGPEDRESLEIVSRVLPFRTNEYVLENLIDWDRAAQDPIFKLNFYDRTSLPEEDYQAVRTALNGDSKELADVILSTQRKLNPHPSSQAQNVPLLDGHALEGVQHKYTNTVLVFPSQAQTCFAYCTFCFRWPQFVNGPVEKFKTRERDAVLNYLRIHPQVTDVLFTGGDPMIMSAETFAHYLEPLLAPEFEHITNIRIGTKFLAYWPHRVLYDGDSDQLLRLFEKVIASGKHLTIMAHFNHPQEMRTEVCRLAIRRLRETGAAIRTQSPLLKNINDDASVWRDMWRQQVNLGLVPYYMFIMRDTGPHSYFEVPLLRAHQIFSDAQRGLSGLAKTARGPVMSSSPGKICVDGTLRFGEDEYFVLRYLQARDPQLTSRPFLARLDESASWLTDLTPAPGNEAFFPPPDSDLMH